MKIQLLLADEADLVLIGAQAILKDRPDWGVIQTARSGGELLETARRWKPDIILFNEHLDPLIDVLALVERLKQTAPIRARLFWGIRSMGCWCVICSSAGCWGICSLAMIWGTA